MQYIIAFEPTKEQRDSVESFAQRFAEQPVVPKDPNSKKKNSKKKRKSSDDNSQDEDTCHFFCVREGSGDPWTLDLMLLMSTSTTLAWRRLWCRMYLDHSMSAKVAAVMVALN